MKRSVLITSIVLIGMLLIGATVANAQPLPAAQRTMLLPKSTGGTPSNVGFHPGFQQYYASGMGNTSQPAFVYDLSGAILQTLQPVNIDVRAWNYNPATNLMEVVSYNAKAGGTARGLIDAELDGSGLLTGGTSTLLATMPGNIDAQTMPAYDPINDVFYSRSSGNTVNVVARSDGSLVDTIVLDTVTAGAGSLTNYAIGYSVEEGWLIVTDYTNDTAVIFNLNGDWVGTSALDIQAPSSYSIGFANGQLFVFDGAQAGWQGYDIGAAAPVGSGYRFNVTKTFSDGITDEVEVTLTCNSGLPLEQSFTIAGGDPAGVTFVVTDIPDTGADCAVTESGGPDGYTPVLNGGAGCEWAVIAEGFYSCRITNEAIPGEFTLNKEWVVTEEAGDDVIREALLFIICDQPILDVDFDIDPDYDGSFDDEPDLYGVAAVVPGNSSMTATIDTSNGPARCTGSEGSELGMVLQTGVEVTSDCPPASDDGGVTPTDPATWLEVTAGGSAECTITNTVFFEGIPSLNQYGLAIMALLMLGMGMVGFRRFA